MLEKSNIYKKVLMFFTILFLAYFFIQIYLTIKEIYWSFFKIDLLTSLKNIGLKNYLKIISDNFFSNSLKNTIYFVFYFSLLFGCLNLIYYFLTLKLKNQYNYIIHVFVIFLYFPVILSLGIQNLFNTKFPVANKILNFFGITNYPHWITSPKWAKFTIFLFFSLFLAVVIYSIFNIIKTSIKNNNHKKLFIVLIIILPFFIKFITVNIGIISSVTNGGPAGSTIIFDFFLYNTSFVFFNLGYASAISIIVSLIILPLVIIIYKIIIKYNISFYTEKNTTISNKYLKEKILIFILLIPVIFFFIWQFSTSLKTVNESRLFSDVFIPQERPQTLYKNKLYYIYKLNNKKIIILSTNKEYTDILYLKKTNSTIAFIKKYENHKLNKKINIITLSTNQIRTADKKILRNYNLFFFKNNKTNQFIILQTKKISYLPFGKPIKIKFPKIKQETFIKFNFDNYYNTIFNSLPRIRNNQMKDVSFVFILTSFFKEIPHFILYFVNSFVIFLLKSFLSIIIAYSITFIVFNKFVQFKKPLIFIALFFIFISPYNTFISQFIFIKRLGCLNTYCAAIFNQLNIDVSVLIFYLFFNYKKITVNNNTNCNFKQMFYVIPLVLLVNIYLYWNNVISDFVYIFSNYMHSLPYGLLYFNSLYRASFNYIASAVIISYIFSSVFFIPFIILAYKYVIKNLKIVVENTNNIKIPISENADKMILTDLNKNKDITEKSFEEKVESVKKLKKKVENLEKKSKLI